MYFQPADLFFTRRTGAISKLIRHFTQSQVSHVGLIAYGGSPSQSVSVEALFTGVIRHPLWNYYRQRNTEIEIWRPINMSNAGREIVVNSALSTVGDAYGYFDILTQLADALIPKEPYFFRRLGKIGKWSVCSCHVMRAFNKGGLDFGLEPNEGHPGDIRKFCQENPDKYELIRPLKLIEKGA